MVAKDTEEKGLFEEAARLYDLAKVTIFVHENMTLINWREIY